MTAVNLPQKRERKAAWKMTPGKFVLYAFMYLFAILCLIPLVWLVRTAFVPKELELDMLAVGWVPTFSNITRIWGMAMWGNYYINTLIVVAGVLAAQFVTITMAGYAFARLNFYGKNTLFILFLTQIPPTC